MKIINASKELKAKWEPILNGWLEEVKIKDTDFTIEIYPHIECWGGGRGDYNQDKLIVLPVGSNDLDEIKFCFFHEVRHYQQDKKGKLFISPFLPPKHRLKIERDAMRFALKHQPRLSPWVKRVCARYEIKYEEMK